MKKIALLLLSLLALTPAIARAAVDPAAVQQAQAYLQGLTTVRAHFVQTIPNGDQMSGTFYLSRPGKLRFEYDPPARDFVVADGVFIYFYDGQLGQQTNAPIGQTLADFLLRKKLKLSGDVTVTDVTRGGGLLQIALVQTDNPGAGTLTLGFQEQPDFQLRKWRVVDATGAVSEVTLTDVQRGVKMPGKLFVYTDPANLHEGHYNQ